MQLVISTEFTATTLFANVPYNAGIKNLISGMNLSKTNRGRPASMIEDNVLNTCIEKDTSQTSRELAKRIGISHTAILKHLPAIGKVRKMDKWVPTNCLKKINSIV